MHPSETVGDRSGPDRFGLWEWTVYRVDAEAFKAEHLRVLIALASELAKAVESRMKHREKDRAASMMPTPHMATEATAFERTLTHA